MIDKRRDLCNLSLTNIPGHGFPARQCYESKYTCSSRPLIEVAKKFNFFIRAFFLNCSVKQCCTVFNKVQQRITVSLGQIHFSSDFCEVFRLLS